MDFYFGSIRNDIDFIVVKCTKYMNELFIGSGNQGTIALLANQTLFAREALGCAPITNEFEYFIGNGSGLSC